MKISMCIECLWDDLDTCERVLSFISIFHIWIGFPYVESLSNTYYFQFICLMYLKSRLCSKGKVQSRWIWSCNIWWCWWMKEWVCKLRWSIYKGERGWTWRGCPLIVAHCSKEVGGPWVSYMDWVCMLRWSIYEGQRGWTWRGCPPIVAHYSKEVGGPWV